MRNLIEESKVKDDYCTIDGVSQYKIVRASIVENQYVRRYYIIIRKTDNDNNEGHCIYCEYTSNKRTFPSYKTKFYTNTEAFEKAIKRIEKKAIKRIETLINR